MSSQRYIRRLATGVLVPGLLTLCSSGCGTGLGESVARSEGQADPRMYRGCTDGRSLKEIQRAYHLVIPADVEKFRFCDQEDWSGAAGEMRFDTSRRGLERFLAESSGSRIQLNEIVSSGLGGKWQSV